MSEFPPSSSDFESAPDAYSVKLDSFEGPLDLLIHLIKKHEVNIYDIPIALITQQYLEYIEMMKELNLDTVGEFLVMAATLIHIKSKMLLPRPETADRWRARRRSARGAGAPAARAPEVQGRGRAAARAGGAARRAVDSPRRPHRGNCRRRLRVRARGRGRSLQPARGLSRSARAREAAAEECCCRRRRCRSKCASISCWRCCRRRKPAASRICSRGTTPRGAMIVTFLALLEMIRLKLIRVFQTAAFGPIRVYKRARPADAPVPIGDPESEKRITKNE